MNEERPAADHCSGTTSREDKMSKEAITKVVQRAISDAGFRRQLSTDPTGALRGFDLSADEAAALRAGDAGRLSALGVDQRMSKAFALGGAAAAATRPGGTDLNASGLNAGANSGLSSGLNAGANSGGVSSGMNAGANSAASGAPSALNTGGANALSNADATGAGGSFGSALAQGSDASRALIDDGASGARTIVPTEPGGQLTADIDGAAGSMSNASADDSSEAYLTKVGYDSGAAANADATGGTAARASAINDDPDGFLAANANADLSGRQVTDAHDRGDRGLAANARADQSGRGVTDAHDRGDGAAAANADASGGSAGDGTAFIDESESYLTKVGYDSNAAESAVTDAHDRGDHSEVTRIADDTDADSAHANDGGSHLSS